VQAYLTKKYVGTKDPQATLLLARAEVRKLQDADEKSNERM
jgi:hypothetical protein